MSEFISKLQYKNYEKGEFTDEKIRDQQQTIELIKNFPWDSQRGVDVQLTAPSVTLCGPYGDYLKVGIYFNGKFCAYYLGADHHLFEYHAETLEDIYPLITDFFNGQTDTEKFERNMFSLGAVKHFKNGNFIYSIKPASVYLRIVLLIILSLFMLFDAIMVCMISAPLPAKLLLLLIAGAVLAFVPYYVYLTIRYFIQCKNMVLKLSSGIDTFQFGTEEDMVEYEKSDISEINTYGTLTGKSKPILTLMEMVFKDGSKITIPGMMIDPVEFIWKFPNCTVNRFNQSRPITKIAWDFASGR